MKSGAAASAQVETSVTMILVGGLIIGVGIYISETYFAITHSALCWILAFCFGAMGFVMVSLGYKQMKAAWAHRHEDEKSEMLREKSEDRFDELERLKRRDLITPEEYAAKRQEILNGL